MQLKIKNTFEIQLFKIIPNIFEKNITNKNEVLTEIIKIFYHFKDNG